MLKLVVTGITVLNAVSLRSPLIILFRWVQGKEPTEFKENLKRKRKRARRVQNNKDAFWASSPSDEIIKETPLIEP